MEPTYHAISTLDWNEVVAVFNAAYQGYVVPLSMSADDLRQRCTAEDTSLAHSVVLRSGNDDIGIALVAVRGDHARLAAFGLAPAWRGRGLGSVILRQVLARVPEPKRWELEVIEHNTPAHRLYEAAGFRVVDRLGSYERPPTAERVERPLQRMTVGAAAERLATASTEDLPWQLAPRSLGRLRDPWFAVNDGEGSHAILNAASREALALRWLFDAGRRTADPALADTVRSIAATYAPDRPIRIAPLVPSSHDAQMLQMGFVRQALTQLRMVR